MSQSEQKIRVGLVGLGSVCSSVHYPGLKRIPGVEIAGICDADPERLELRRREWGIEAGFENMSDLLSGIEPDAVVIATPNVYHRELVLEALGAGCHVHCEKPLGMNFDETVEMYRAGRDSGLRHMTAFTYRFAPSMRYIRHLVKSGQLGELRHFRSQRFLDWPETSWGWRQYKDKAGAGAAVADKAEAGKAGAGEAEYAGECLRESHALGRHPIQVRCLDIWIPVAAQRPRTVVIGHDQHNVGTRRSQFAGPVGESVRRDENGTRDNRGQNNDSKRMGVD